MKPYEQIADLAADVQADGYAALAKSLLEVHRGIFNGTELFMAWRFEVAKVLDLPVTNVTRAKAATIWQMLDKELS